MMDDILGKFFYGRSLAIIGASTDPTKLGGRPLRMNKELRFGGVLYPVHPSAKSVQGLPAINSISELPDRAVDCALVAVPQSAVKAAIRELAGKHVPLAIILSSGYAEHSAEGARLQDELTEIAGRSNMRLVGPNSMGGISFETGICATFTSVAEHHARNFPQLGGVSIASQSGFIGSHLMGLLRDRGIGIAKWLATGNQCDIDIADVIAHYAKDDITRIIAVYLEGVTKAGALRDALETARQRGKHVVALKVGRTELGARAIASHTAALVGNSDAYDAAFRRHGVMAAGSLEELADLVAALDTRRRVPGPRLGIATVSGGFGILMSDVAATMELELPPLPPDQQDKLKGYYDLASTQNPVDMGSLSRIGPAVKALLDTRYDAIAVGCGHFGLIDSQISAFAGELKAFREDHPHRFIGVTAMLTDERKRELQDLGVFTCEDPSRLIATMARLARHARPSSDGHGADIPTIPDLDEARIRASTDERSARALLRDCGIPVAAESLAQTREEAVEIAKGMGGKVVLKIASTDIAHKSEVGGVLLGLEGEGAIANGFDRILSRVRAAMPQARIDGILVSPLIDRGVEILVGFTNDATFGPLVAVGLGGVFVETLKDKAVELAPFGRDVALQMLQSLKGVDVLHGVRGQPPVDLHALADVLSRVSAFAAKYRHLVDSLEINPLIAHASGVVAVDALLIPGPLPPSAE